MEFAYVTMILPSIKNQMYHYTAPYKTVICNSDGVTGDHISHR
jgi:hypothetical protein